jgi:hypothetical protein
MIRTKDRSLNVKTGFCKFCLGHPLVVTGAEMHLRLSSAWHQMKVSVRSPVSSGLLAVEKTKFTYLCQGTEPEFLNHPVRTLKTTDL